MRAIHCCTRTMLLGFAALLTAGCDDSNQPAAPLTGTIEITVSTASATTDIDPDGYTLSIDGGPGQAIGANAAVTISALPTGRHLVRLDGVAPNCSVSGSSSRLVDVNADEAALPISFSVACIAKDDTGAGDWDY